MILRLLTFSLLVLGLSSGLAAQSPPPPVFSDAQIEAQVRERLAKSVIGKDGFTVRVRGGVVYWEGNTTVAQHKGAATRMAKSAGARRVVNNIRVAGAKAPARKAATPATPAAAPPSPTKPPAPAPKPAAAPQAESLPRATVRWVPVRR